MKLFKYIGKIKIILFYSIIVYVGWLVFTTNHPTLLKVFEVICVYAAMVAYFMIATLEIAEQFEKRFEEHKKKFNGKVERWKQMWGSD